MKTRIFTLLMILLIVGITASAQNKKGNWFVDGLTILTLQAGTAKISTDFGNSTTNISGFHFGPSILNGGVNFVAVPTINYCFSDQLSGGIFLDLNFDSQNDKNNSESSSTVFAVGPAVRYYFTNTNKIRPFAEGKFGIGSVSSKVSNEDNSELLTEWYLGVGSTYFVKPKIGIDLTLGYGNMVVNNLTLSNSKTTYSLVNFGIGLLIGF